MSLLPESMQVSNVMPGRPPAQPAFNAASMDVDMDLDISLDVDDDGEAMNIEAQPSYFPDTYQGGSGDLADEDEGAISEYGQDNQPILDEFAPEKVHIRGLDNFTTDDVKAFVAEHSDLDFSRLEWIDDTSANMVYDSPETAFSVLSSLADPADPIIDDSSNLYQLHRAKPLSSHPSTTLQVRLAHATDRKKPRAREASRFYLMNPEYDPLERRQRQTRKRGGHHGNHRPNRRPQDDEPTRPFDESMYDEEPASITDRLDKPLERDNNTDGRGGRRRRRRRSPDPDQRGGDLFGDRINKQPNGDDRLRGRSASPSREGDGRFGFDEDSDHRRSAARRTRQRSLTPPPRRPRSPVKRNTNKELMDVIPSRSGVLQSPSSYNKELFPAQSSPAPENGSVGKELFPRKATHSNHRRKDAFDAADTADLFAEQLVKRSPELRSHSLADRITGGPGAGRLSTSAALEGINIRGAASQGFAIKGSALGVNNPKVKELFPDKGDGSSSSGADLFEGRITGRGAQRRRAQDLF